MIRIVIVTFFIFFALSCHKEVKIEKPKDLIPENQFSEILYDMFLINSAKGVNKKLLEDEGIFPEEYIFKKHNIDSLRFAASNKYYAFNQKTYDKILNQVKQRVEREKEIYQKELDAEEEANKKRQDSVKASAVKKLDSIKILNQQNQDIRIDLPKKN